jgi:hypothetical protein
MPDKSPKYEREIAEILDRLDREEPRAQRVKRQARQMTSRRRVATNRFSRARGVFNQFGATAGWVWIGVTFGLGLLGLILGALSPILATICAVLMFLSFFSPLIRQVSGAPSPAPSTMWRGQVVDIRPRGFRALLRYRWRRFLGGGGPFR